MVETNVEKTTSLWMGLFIVAMSLIYALVTMGKATWIIWIAVVWGIFLSVFLFLESGIFTYFQKKDYKRIGIGDAVVFLTLIFGAVILINTLLLFQVINESAPNWLVSFAGTTGLISGIGGAILGVIHIVYPRFK